MRACATADAPQHGIGSPDRNVTSKFSESELLSSCLNALPRMLQTMRAPQSTLRTPPYICTHVHILGKASCRFNPNPNRRDCISRAQQERPETALRLAARRAARIHHPSRHSPLLLSPPCAHSVCASAPKRQLTHRALPQDQSLTQRFDKIAY